jgi:hypothetical protein
LRAQEKKYKLFKKELNLVIGNDLERIRFRYHGIFNFDRKKQVYSIIFQIEGIKGY